MARIAAQLKDREESKIFAALLNETVKPQTAFEGTVVKGRIIGFTPDDVIVDVGLKSEGRVPMKEFGFAAQKGSMNVGDIIEVFVERVEDRQGEAVLSREKAKREEAWSELERLHLKNERVNGVIFGKVKGGFTVDLNGAVAFLPGSQVDIRPVKDIGPLFGTPQPFLILKMDHARGNIVVSRRAVLEESRAEARTDLMAQMEEGRVLQGVVKNITDYGAFIDLGGVDGLLHVTDISWKRVNHPSEVLQIGQSLDVMVIRYNKETGRVSLGLKQLEKDPWEGAERRYQSGQRFKGRISNITDYGAFVELEDGVEGLVHVSEMSWTKKNVHPGKIVSTSQEVEVVVLDVDMEKRRISLGIKQCQPNPWKAFADSHNVGDVIEGEARNVTEFGVFVALDAEIDGMVHMSDISWEVPAEEAIKTVAKGSTVKAKILEMDPEKERVALGIKQLTEKPANAIESTRKGKSEGEAAAAGASAKKGDVVTCTVSAVEQDGIHVTLSDGSKGYIKRNDLSRERSEQRPDRFAVGEKVDAKIVATGKKGEVSLSIKAREIDEDKAAMAEYGSSDSGASLGDILGAALGREAEAAEKPKKKASKKKDAE
ncbi:MAG: 30S ribosomal protein S1 [Alphaproteobacteria bacterium]|nr:30S ribosomal protein S1 [Alphaproteobacteria bacterium]